MTITYLERCASCHGVDGRGGCAAAKALRRPPSDPTRIAGRAVIRRARAYAAPLVGLALLLGAPGPTPVWASERSPSNSEEARCMVELSEAMGYLLPLSFGEKSFVDPKHREEIRSALLKLAEGGRCLEAHPGERDAAYAYLCRSLAHDAREIRQRYLEGHVLEARFLVQTLAETCAACHSRLPAKGDALSPSPLPSNEEIATLPLASQAKFAYAMHRFERALELYEELFASPGASPNNFDLDGAIDDYLELVIRVRRDPERAQATLARLAGRRDLTERLRSEIRQWRSSLGELQQRKLTDASLGEARRLVARAEDPSRFADEREALVVYLEASGVLYRALAGGELRGRDLAEVYYLLGVIETRVGRSFWLSQAEVFLETAIRTAPGTRVAEQAYAVLEDFLVAGFSGSGGTEVPPDVASKLDELLAIASRPSAGSSQPPEQPK